MWSEPEICSPKYWKLELMGREDEAGRCEDGQMISRTGQTDQWQSVQGWGETGNSGDCWCTKWSPTLSNEEGNKQASKMENGIWTSVFFYLIDTKLNCCYCYHYTVDTATSWWLFFVALETTSQVPERLISKHWTGHSLGPWGPTATILVLSVFVRTNRTPDFSLDANRITIASSSSDQLVKLILKPQNHFFRLLEAACSEWQLVLVTNCLTVRHYFHTRYVHWHDKPVCSMSSMLYTTNIQEGAW